MQISPDSARNLRRRFPDALVLVASTLDDFLGALRRVRPEAFVDDPRPFGARLFLVIDERGVGLSHDGYRDGVVAQFDWSEINWVGVDADNFTRLRGQGSPMPVLVFDVTASGQSVPLPFYVMAEDLTSFLQFPLDERAMRPFVERARELGGTGMSRSLEIPLDQGRWTIVSPTARAMLRITVGAAVLVSATAVAFIIANGVWKASVPAVVIPGVFTVALAVLVTGYLGRLEARRGYTTLNETFKFADQVDPKTGAVIRRAGEAALTSDQRRERIAATKGD